jgi:small neutral amino acid transporter SnatA (MarC family)
LPSIANAVVPIGIPLALTIFTKIMGLFTLSIGVEFVAHGGRTQIDRELMQS